MSSKIDQYLTDANRALITDGDLDEIGKYFTADYVTRSGSKGGEGHEFVRKFIKRLRASLPDVKVEKVEVLNEADGVVTWQRTLSGTHRKAMQGIPPSEKKVKWTEMLVSRFDGDKIAEDCMVSELAGALMAKLPRKDG